MIHHTQPDRGEDPADALLVSRLAVRLGRRESSAMVPHVDFTRSMKRLSSQQAGPLVQHNVNFWPILGPTGANKQDGNRDHRHAARFP